MNKKIVISAMLAAGLLSLNSAQAAEQGRGLYLGLFGGGSISDNSKFSQSGVAYKRLGDGQASADYDLYVDVNGRTTTKVGALGGLHIGYEWTDIPMSDSASGWALRPALELEGYYLGTSKSGNLSNPQLEPAIWHGVVEKSHSIAAGSHTFQNSYKLDMGILLTNVVFNFKTPWTNKIFPYVGVGIGAAITSVSGADSRQTGPVLEPTMNHFNANPNALNSSFAAQGKAGLRAEIVDHLSIFAEYRYLHVAGTGYSLGATVYPSIHSETSNWNSRFGAMDYHSGVLGIEYGF